MIEIRLTYRTRLKHSLPISFNIHSNVEHRHYSTLMLNKNFVHCLLLINNLLRLETNTDVTDRQDFLAACKKEFRTNKTQLHLIDEFQATYTTKKALWWYTREGFFSRIIDQILRSTTEYFQLFLFARLFLRDIYEQLREHQYPSTVRVYLGQIMWPKEIDYLRNARFNYLANNTFWLTNTNRDQIIQSLEQANKREGESMVLLTIDADPTMVHEKPFADISQCCHFESEGEILFMAGSIFRLVDFEQVGAMYFVQLELCEDNEEFYQSLLTNDGNVYGHEKIDLRNFGEILYRMEQYDLAERVYEQLLSKLPSNDPVYPDLYLAMGLIGNCKKEYDASMKAFEKALKYKVKMNPTDYLTIGKIHASIGEIHRLKGNDKEALKCFEKAVDIYIREHADEHQSMADFYENIASIYRRAKQYENALNYSKKALAVDEKQLSSNFLGVAKSHNNIATVYCLLQQYHLALAHYQQSLAFKHQVFPTPHLPIANSYGNIASVYKTIDDWEKALTYYRKAASIYQRFLPANHSDVIQTNNEIQSIVQILKLSE